MEEVIIPGVIGLVVFFIIFLLIREIMMWYWKVNNIIENQERTNMLLAKQNELMEAILNRSQ